MQLADIEGGLNLSIAEGWNQTRKDWELLIGSTGSISMLVEHQNKVIGTTTAVNYANKVAWIGMVLVDKEFRGRGLSKLLLTDILNKLSDSVSVKLDATPAGQQVYKNFEFNDEYLIARMVNQLMINTPATQSDLEHEPATEEDTREIIDCDELIFGANRATLIKSLLSEFPGKAWVLRRNKKILGFALGREGTRYHQIGPVTAENTNDAKALICRALKDLIDLPVVVDIICDKEELTKWLSEIGFTKQREFVRMYRKENPFPGIPGKQFLICGPEFG